MGTKMTPYEIGYLAGTSANEPMDDFEMSMHHDNFIIGYIVGHSEMQSFRAASPLMAAITAGEIAYRYNVPLSVLLPYLGFDAQLREELRQAYADAAENILGDEKDADEN